MQGNEMMEKAFQRFVEIMRTGAFKDSETPAEERMALAIELLAVAAAQVAVHRMAVSVAGEPPHVDVIAEAFAARLFDGAARAHESRNVE